MGRFFEHRSDLDLPRGAAGPLCPTALASIASTEALWDLESNNISVFWGENICNWDPEYNHYSVNKIIPLYILWWSLYFISLLTRGDARKKIICIPISTAETFRSDSSRTYKFRKTS